ncbi:hypothetical protein KAR91_09585 [Candidatus Pacearchaeota archaeon]|nr:hypothetical protein [Candidatus Pacearchaeota archaeon]
MSMKNYEVTGRVARFSTGVVVLSHAQASARIHNLKDLGKGEYEIVNPIEFKNGEKFGYDGDVPKVMASVVTKAGVLIDTPSAVAGPHREDLEKLDKLTLFGMLTGDHGLDFEGADEAALVDAILAAQLVPSGPVDAADELRELTVKSLNKLKKDVLFAALKEGHGLEFKDATKADIIKVLKAN